MPDYGQITGNLDGVNGSSVVPLDDDGAPALPVVYILAASMPDVGPVWSLSMEIQVNLTVREVGELALMLMRRRAAETRGEGAGS